MGLFISCEEATIICTKAQYNEATFLEKIKLNIHLLTCKICGKFAKQNTQLTKVCDKHLLEKDCKPTLSEADKEVMKKELLKQNR